MKPSSKLLLFFLLTSPLIETKEFIYAGIASVPWREKSLEHVVSSLIHQVDHLFIYLNKYEEAPTFLDHPKISYYLSSQVPEGDIGDRGKFYQVENVTGYYLSCDDDLLYPPHYAEDCIAAIEQYGRKVVIGLHGTFIPTTMTNYRNDLWILSYGRELKENTYVHILGTGAMAFHTNTLKLSLKDFPVSNMADIFVGIKAQQHHIPMLCLKHPNRYIDCTPEAWDTRSIWDTIENNCSLETYLSKLFIPWSTNLP